MNDFWKWPRTKKRTSKQLPSHQNINHRHLSDDFYLPEQLNQYSEEELRAMYAPLNDAYEQYQILLKIYNSNHQKRIIKNWSM